MKLIPFELSVASLVARTAPAQAAAPPRNIYMSQPIKLSAGSDGPEGDGELRIKNLDTGQLVAFNDGLVAPLTLLPTRAAAGAAPPHVPPLSPLQQQKIDHLKARRRSSTSSSHPRKLSVCERARQHRGSGQRARLRVIIHILIFVLHGRSRCPLCWPERSLISPSWLRATYLRPAVSRLEELHLSILV